MTDDEPNPYEATDPLDDDSGAIDNGFEDAERPPRDQIEDALASKHTEIKHRDIAIDLVTRQPVFVVKRVASSVTGYYGVEDFDLANYKTHPYLPVTPDDAVFKCVYVPTNPEAVIHGDGGQSTGKTYDFPAGRLMRVPLEIPAGMDFRHQDDLKAGITAQLLVTAEKHNYDDGMVESVARDAFGGHVVDSALDRLEFDA